MPPPPQNVIVSIEGTQAHVSWDPGLSGLSYRVYGGTRSSQVFFE